MWGRSLAAALLSLLWAAACLPAHHSLDSASYTVTSENLRSLLRRAATADGEVVLTTLRLEEGGGETLGLSRSFCRHLHAAGLLRHTLILTTEAASLRVLRALGLPAYLDAAYPAAAGVDFPRGKARWRADAPTGLNREWDVQKHWWALQALRAGLSVLYLDSDNVVLRNPLPALAAAGYDVQGLSDWSGPELPPTGGLLDRDCGGLYGLATDERVAYGSILRESWTSRVPGETLLPAASPCQSTGAWFLRPSPLTQRFMGALLARLEQYPFQWEQAAWNQVVMAHLVGMGSGLPPLRYRLLPVEEFSNIDVYRERLNASLPVRQSILHAGAIHGSGKRKAFQSLGLYDSAFALAEPLPNLLDPAQARASAYTARAAAYARKIQAAGFIAVCLPMAALSVAVASLARMWRRPQSHVSLA